MERSEHRIGEETIALATTANRLKALPTVTLLTALPATLNGSLSLAQILQEQPDPLRSTWTDANFAGRHSRDATAALTSSSYCVALPRNKKRQQKRALDRFFGHHVTARIAARQAKDCAQDQHYRMLCEQHEEELVLQGMGSSAGGRGPSVLSDVPLPPAPSVPVSSLRRELMTTLATSRDVLAARSSEPQACLLDVLTGPVLLSSAGAHAAGEGPLSAAEKLLYVILRTSAVAALADEPLSSARDEEEEVVCETDPHRDHDRRCSAWPVDLLDYEEDEHHQGINWEVDEAGLAQRVVAPSATRLLDTGDGTNTSSESLAQQRHKVEADSGGSWGKRVKPTAARRRHTARRHKPQPHALPLEPRCWLSPATVDLMERSAALRHSLRWSCEPDPVVFATLNRAAELCHSGSNSHTTLASSAFLTMSLEDAASQGRNGLGDRSDDEALRYQHVVNGSMAGIAGLMSASGVSSDVLLQAMSTTSATEAHMRSICDAMVSASGMPLPRLQPPAHSPEPTKGKGGVSRAEAAVGASSLSPSPAANAPSSVASVQPTGAWSLSVQDADVVSLFRSKSPSPSPIGETTKEPSSTSKNAPSSPQGARDTANCEAYPSVSWSGQPFTDMFLPRYPSDMPVCAMVYVALHACVVGLPDPYLLVRVHDPLRAPEESVVSPSGTSRAYKLGGRRRRETSLDTDEPEIHMALSEEFILSVRQQEDDPEFADDDVVESRGRHASHSAAARAVRQARKKRRTDAAFPRFDMADDGRKGTQCSSGLLALLQWGCECGTLFLRLSRLCELGTREHECHAALGSYGQAALEALRLSLSLIRRIVVELAVRPGGPHRVSFHELLDAQQLLSRVQERIATLALVFRVSTTPSWRARETLPGLSSATLLSRLYEHFSKRSLNALGEYSSIFEAGDTEAINGSTGEHRDNKGGSETSSSSSSSSSGDSDGHGDVYDKHDERVRVRSEECAWAANPQREERHRRKRERRKRKLSQGFDPVAFVLVRALRPLNTMLHAWLTRGELHDPFDEFFIVPAYGTSSSGGAAATTTTTSAAAFTASVTTGGFLLDCSRLRLPVFISVDAATDMLHAGISLRVLRAAATHVILSAKHELRVLQSRDDDAEDDMAERNDAHLMGSLVKGFLSSLVGQDANFARANPLPMVNPLAENGRRAGGARTPRGGHLERQTSASSPLSSAAITAAAMTRGRVNYWREYYDACNSVLLSAVMQADAEMNAAAQDGNNMARDTGEEEHGAAGNPVATVDLDRLSTASVDSGTVMKPFLPSSILSGAALPTDTQHIKRASGMNEEEAEPAPTLPAIVSAQTAPAVNRRDLSMESAASHITIAMASDEDGASDEEAMTRRQPQAQRGRPNASSSSSELSMSARSSVLGLHGVAAQNAIRMGSVSAVSSSSAASSRVTTALYGAITEELRQVVRVVQQQEEQTERAREQMKAEYERSVLEQRRQARLVEWKGLRMALRVERLQALRTTTDELRELYAQASAEPPQKEAVSASIAEGGGKEESVNDAVNANPLLGKLVVPLAAAKLHQERRRHHRGHWHRRTRSEEERALLYSMAGDSNSSDERNTDDDEEWGNSSGSSSGKDDGTSSRTHGNEESELSATNGGGDSLALSATRNSVLHRPVRRQTGARGRAGGGLTVGFVTTANSTEDGDSHAHSRRERTGRARRKRIAFDANEATVMGSLSSSQSPHASSLRSMNPSGTLLLPTYTDVFGKAPSRRGGGGSLIAGAAAAATASLLSLPAHSQLRYGLAPSGDGAATLFTLGGHSTLNIRAASAFGSVLTLHSTQRGGGGVSFAGHDTRASPRHSSVFAAPALVHPVPVPQQQSPASILSLRSRFGAGTSSQGEDQTGRRTALRIGEVTAEALSAIAAAQQETDVDARGISGCAALSGLTGLEKVKEDGTQEAEDSSAKIPHDDFGFAHPNEIYVIADINDDEYLAKRVGPKRYNRDELDALLAELALQQEHLRESSVLAPGYLDHCQQVARARLLAEMTGTQCEAAEGNATDHWATDDLFANSPNVWRDEQFDYDMGGISRNSFTGTRLEMFDGKHALACGPDDGTSNAGDTFEAEHRHGRRRRRGSRYKCLVKELTELHLDSTAQASALLWCARYYLSLAQYTSRYLTHKALQLTLLPPYGSLHRLLKQVLDVLLLQNGPAATRIVQTWCDQVVTPALVGEGGCGLFLESGHPSTLQAMAALPAGKRFPSRTALQILNDVFQKEWTSCVLGGDSTMAVAWQLLRQALQNDDGGGSRFNTANARSQRRPGQETVFADVFNADSMWLDQDDAAARQAYLRKYDDGGGRGGGASHGASVNDFDDWLTGPPSPLFLLAEMCLAYDQPNSHGDGLSTDPSPHTRRSTHAAGGRRVATATTMPAGAGGTFFWLLPNNVMRDYGDLFTTLLFWKTAEQLTAHTWRECLLCGEPDAFFFCSTTRHLLLTLQQHIWYGVASLCDAYRASLQFDSGVLFGYACLEAFTEDHRRFVAECRFAAMLTGGFARVRRLVYRVLRLVEGMDRALRASNVELAAAERRAMAAYHALVDTASDTDDDNNNEEEGGSNRDAADSAFERGARFRRNTYATAEARSGPLSSEGTASSDRGWREGSHASHPGNNGEDDVDPLGGADSSELPEVDLDAAYAECLRAAPLSSSTSSSSSSGSTSSESDDPSEATSMELASEANTSTTAGSERTPRPARSQARTRKTADPVLKKSKDKRKKADKTEKKKKKAKSGRKKDKRTGGSSKGKKPMTEQEQKRARERKRKKMERKKKDKAFIAAARPGRMVLSPPPGAPSHATMSASGARHAPATAASPSGLTPRAATRRRSSSLGAGARRGPRAGASTTSPPPATPVVTPRPERGRRSSAPNASPPSSHAVANQGGNQRARSRSTGASRRGSTKAPISTTTSAAASSRHPPRARSAHAGARGAGAGGATSTSRSTTAAAAAAARAARRLQKAAELKERRRTFFLACAKRTIQEAYAHQRHIIRDEVRLRLQALARAMRKLVRELACVRDACAAGLEAHDDGVDELGVGRAEMANAFFHRSLSRPRRSMRRNNAEEEEGKEGGPPVYADDREVDLDNDEDDDDDSLIAADDEMRAYQDPALAYRAVNAHHAKHGAAANDSEEGDEKDASQPPGREHEGTESMPEIAITGDVQYRESIRDRERREWRAYRRRVLQDRMEKMKSLVRLVEESLISLKRKV